MTTLDGNCFDVPVLVLPPGRLAVIPRPFLQG
jgi:hypothetical protein